jgi:hypothetical protein
MISDIEWVETIWLTAFLDIFQEQVVWCQETVYVCSSTRRLLAYCERHSGDVKTAFHGFIEFADVIATCGNVLGV